MSEQRPQPPRVSPGRGVRLLTVNRVPVYFSPICLFFIAILAMSFEPIARDRLAIASGSRTYGLAVLISLITMVSIVLHELGHALVAQRLKFDVEAISIFGFVGLTAFRPEPQTPLRGFLVSVSGPLVNLVIGIPATLWYASVNPNSVLGIFVFGLAWTNIALGVLNLLPGLPLDGGAALLSGLWKLTGDRNKAARAAAYAGFGVAAAIGIYALDQNQRGGATYLLFIAVMLALGAGSALRRTAVVERLPGLTAGGAARAAITVDANLPLSEALRRAEAGRYAAVIVADSSGRPWALMNGAAVDAVPAERRPWTTINEVSRPIEDGMRLLEDLEGQELMDALAQTPASEYLVCGSDGSVKGVLVMVDVVARLDPAAAARLAARR